VSSPETADQPRRVLILANDASGSFAQLGRMPSAVLTEAFRERGIGAECLLLSQMTSGHAEPDRVLSAHVLDGFDTIAAAGGDGTILMATKAALATGKPLIVLPLGTMNALARDGGIPLDVHQAAARLGPAYGRSIDVAEVNGEPFLVAAVLGLFAGLAKERERLRRGVPWHEGPSLLARLGRQIFGGRTYPLRFLVDGRSELLKTHTAIISNNPLAQRPQTGFERDRLDSGLLGLYVQRKAHPLADAKIVASGLLGRLGTDPDIWSREAAELVVESEREGENVLLPLTLDGEVRTMQTPLRFTVRPKALRILNAKPAAQTKHEARTP